MRLYIVRHGIACDLGQHGIHRDADRPLSPEGRTRTALAARGFRTLGHPPARIGSSPLVRAQQTAAIFHKELNLTSPLIECDFMAPGGSISDALEWADFQQSSKAVMLIGHMPDVTWLTQSCLPAAQRLDMHFKKAAIACIFFENQIGVGQGQLEWFHQPRELRAMATASKPTS